MQKNVLLAAFGAGLAITSQTAGKAARDAIFLGQFHVTKLPALLVASSILSMIAALAMTRAMSRASPGRLVPVANLASAGLLLAEWWLFGRLPKGAAIAIYLHQAALGAILVSGFYSVVNECFDPRTARRAMGTIGFGATLGGLVGALVAERAAAMLGTAAVLPILAAVQLGAGALLAVLARRSSATSAVTAAEPAPPPGDALASIVRLPLLRQLAILVVVGTVAAAFIDYVFKARAAAGFAGDDLLRFFAAFYGGVGVLTALVQWALGKRALESWGLARTIATLPGAVAATGAAALVFPGIPTIVLARASENVLRNSLYRQAYETLYTPIPPRERRSTKTVVDVGIERLGDALGGALVALALVAGMAASSILIVGAIAVSLLGVWVAKRVQSSYVQALEHGLKSRAIALDLDDVGDRTSRATIVQSLERIDPLESRIVAGDAGGRAPVPAPPSPESTTDPLLQRAAHLRSGDPARVRAGLAAGSLTAPLVAHAMQLLAWDEVAGAAAEALARVAPRVVGQLVDALLDPDEEFTIRRRLPRVICAASGPRTVQGLLLALADARFEVRFRAARALARLHAREAEVAIDADAVYAAILRELAADEQAFRHLALLDEDSGDSVVVDEVLRERVGRGLEHVFTLLALVLPVEPIRIAFRALHTTDPGLRGTALEYLEQVLPPAVRDRLWPRIEPEARPRPTPRPGAQVVADLMESRAAISMSLQALTRPDV